MATIAPDIFVTGSAHIEHKMLFHSISMEIRAGQWTALLGPSGIGKSTLLRLIADLHHVAQFEGKIRCSDDLPLHGRVSYMAQDDLLLPWANIEQNIMLGSRLRGEKPPYQLAQKLINSVGLADHVHKYPSMLSGGQRQRVALLRTLIENRPVILLDEPFSTLDMCTRADMHDLATQYFKDYTVLLVTHDPNEAARLCQSIYYLHNQSLVKADNLSPPFPKSIDDKQVFTLQTKLTQQIRAGGTG